MKTSFQRIAFFRDVWSKLIVPVRPGPEGLALYQKLLDSFTNKRVLVLGATPELVDMALQSQSDCIVSIEQNPDIMAAMRQLGEENWSSVQMIAGNWLKERPEFHEAFNYIVCDGGLLFLEFPGQWKRLFKLVHSYLAPGGVFVAKEWAEPSGERDYKTIKSDLITTYTKQCTGWVDGQKTKAFIRMASELRLAAFIGMTLDDGSFAQPPLVDRLDSLLEELETCFPDPEHIEITHAAIKYLARSQPGSTDTISGVRYEGAAKLLRRHRFQCKEHPLPDAPVPGGNYMFIAQK